LDAFSRTFYTTVSTLSTVVVSSLTTTSFIDVHDVVLPAPRDLLLVRFRYRQRIAEDTRQQGLSVCPGLNKSERHHGGGIVNKGLRHQVGCVDWLKFA